MNRFVGTFMLEIHCITVMPYHYNSPSFSIMLHACCYDGTNHAAVLAVSAVLTKVYTQFALLSAWT